MYVLCFIIRWMDGWMDGWMDRWMDGLMDRWMDRLIDRLIDRYCRGRTSGCMLYASAFFGGDGWGGGRCCDGMGCGVIRKVSGGWYPGMLQECDDCSLLLLLLLLLLPASVFLYQLYSPVYFFKRYKFFTHGPYLPTYLSI